MRPRKVDQDRLAWRSMHHVGKSNGWKLRIISVVMQAMKVKIEAEVWNEERGHSSKCLRRSPVKVLG